MDIQTMAKIRLMKKNVENATLDTINGYLAEIPILMEYAAQSPRETKLELYEIARSIITKTLEIDPAIATDPNWQPFADLGTQLNQSIMETRFALR